MCCVVKMGSKIGAKAFQFLPMGQLLGLDRTQILALFSSKSIVLLVASAQLGVRVVFEISSRSIPSV